VYQTKAEKDSLYIRFLMEGYDSTIEHYFAKTEEVDYLKLFELSIQKVAGTDVGLSERTRSGLAQYAYEQMMRQTEDKQKQFVLDVLSVALYNLQPAGRNGVLSKKQEVALRQNVSNIDTTKDLYKDIGVEKGASVEKVEQAYNEKKVILSKATTTEAKEELKKITYAKKVLTDTASKKLYDEQQIEPTVNGMVLDKTLYVSMSKISPTTLREFGLIVDRVSSTPGLNSLIFDFRGNIGGSLDFLQYFLGVFIGRNQFAFDLLHHGEYQAQRTSIDRFAPLARYKDIVILTDGMTQSTAELTAAVFKRLHLAKIVGTTTRGWGTVENTFPMKTVIDPTETYALFLVHSITLNENNDPIEGRGVAPDISITSPTYKKEITDGIINSSLRRAVLEYAAKQPLR
jgi:C-terminal processing protease CtpA/Prc